MGGPQGCKKPCVITLQYPGTCTVYMAVSDQIELTKWFNALEHGTKMEGMMRQRKEAIEAQRARRAVKTDAAPKDPTVKMKKSTKPEQISEAQSPKEKEVRHCIVITCTCMYVFLKVLDIHVTVPMGCSHVDVRNCSLLLSLLQKSTFRL